MADQTAVLEPETTTAPSTGNDTGTNVGNDGDDKTYTKQQFKDAVAVAANNAKIALKSDKELRDEIRKDIEAELAKDTQREQGQFKPLYEAAETELATLRAQIEASKAVATERDDAMSVVNDLVDTELKDAPAYVAEALEGKSAVEKLRYVQKHKASWQAAKPQGGRETPRPAGDAFTIEQDRDAMTTIRRETKAAL